MANKKNLPNIPICISDWEKDCGVLSLEAEAAWLKIIFKMWTNGNTKIYTIPIKGLCQLWKSSGDSVKYIISELERKNICDIEFNNSFIEFKKKGLYHKNTIVYGIILSRSEEKFLKIGITHEQGSIKKRYRYYGLHTEFLFTESYPNRLDALKRERELHLLFSKYRYNPSIDFGGKTECFEVESVNKIEL